ncbi:extracellular solute-binding protein [Pseudonocardia sp. KRD291]|uniref:extracellular solute-binding protein n=1 Tax=Pseudonocardia sp. KRD291 TaxID=2792007 RepID=UPI001C49E5E7|nr:extracellular solute-binding protein [Pseudonocardia sp. KRD291]MBW0101014.1 extracellular solute-binding protein [Pseudonocardia sp. KRD291]
MALAAGCGSGPEMPSGAGTSDPATAGLYAAAAAEPPLVLYSSQNPELIEATVAAFSEVYPDVDVQPVRLASGTLTTRYAAERSAQVCSAGAVIAADPELIREGTSRGWFAPLEAGRIPEIARWPREAVVMGRAARISVIPAAIATNTTAVPEASAPADPRALLDPALRGRIVLTDPRSTPGWMSLMNMLREQYGDEFLRRLAGQELRVADSSVPATQQAAAGERAVAFPTILSVVEPLAEQGAPLTTRVISDGPTTGVEQFVSVSDCGQTRNAAALYANFLLTPAGQTAVNGTVAASPRRDLPGMLPLPAGYRSPEPTSPQDQRRILDLLGLT